MPVSLAELDADVDENGEPDLLGQSLAVQGVVSVIEGAEGEVFFLERCGRGVRLTQHTSSLVHGDAIRADVVLARTDGQLVLDVTRYNRIELPRIDCAAAEAAGRLAAAPGNDAVMSVAWPPVPGFPLWILGACAVLSAALALGTVFGVRRWRRSGLASRAFRAVFEQAPHAMFLTNERCGILKANAAARRMLDGVDDLTAFNLEDLLRITGDKDLAAALDGEQALVAAKLVKPSGTEIEVSIRAAKVRIGSHERRVFSVLDAGEHPDREQFMKRLYQVILQEMPVDVAVLTPQGQYLYASRGLADDPSVRRSATGKTDVELCRELGLDNEVALRRRAHRRRAVTTRELVKFDETLPFKTGEQHYTRYYHPVLNQRGDVCMVVSYATEMTELKRLRTEHAALTEENAYLRRMKETILQNLSHEFRTPLTGIMGAVQLLRSEVPESQRELAAIAERNGSRLLNMLNEMLDLADLQADDLQLTYSIVNVVEETKAVVKAMQAEAEEKGLFLRLRGADKELWSRLDAACFYRAMRHLVDNAIKFTEAGGILVELDADEDRIFLHVMDSGVGMEDGYLPRAYEPFEQESSGMSRQFEGMGIGLSITERLIGLMEGTIAVQSEKEGGTMFSVMFPRVLTRASAGGEQRSRIAVFERDADEQHLLRYVLDSFCDVLIVSDLDYLTELVRAGHCDAAIIGIDGGGEQVGPWLRRFRQEHGTDGMLMIGVHTNSQPGDRERFLALGLSEYLVRPVDKAVLLNALKGILAHAEVSR